MTAFLRWLTYTHTQRRHADAELDALRRSVARGQPFGSQAWQKRTAKLLDLEYTFRKQGRPRKTPANN